MKKKILALLCMMVCLSITACAGGQKADNTAKVEQGENKNLSNEENSEVEASKPEELETTVEQEEEEKETTYNIGDSAQLKDWEISVTDMKIVETIAMDYGSFSPKENGNKYVQVFAIVNNNGKQAERFLPLIGIGDNVNAKVLYGDGYEFSATNLLGYDNDLHDSTVNPLSSQTGEIVFEVPEAVASSEDELLIRFTSGNDTVQFKLR